MPKGRAAGQGGRRRRRPAGAGRHHRAGRVLRYDYLIMAPGTQLDYGKVPA